MRFASFRERESFWAVDWERFSGRGALADQVRFSREWDALRSYAASARGAAVRRRGDLRGAGKRRSSRPSRRCSGAGWLRARRPTRTRTTGSCGGIRCTTGRRCAGGGTAGGSSGCGARCRCSTWPGSTTSGGSFVLGRARGRADCGVGAVAARARAGGVRRRRRCAGIGGLGCRGPGRDHAGRWRGCASRSGFPGWSSCSSASTAAAPDSVHRFENHVESTGSCTRAPTTTTPRAAGTRRWTLRRVRGWMRLWRRSALASAAVVEPDPAGSGLAGAGRDDAGPGRARARARGADEQPGAGGWRWRWRMEAGALKPALARRLREATEAAGRLVE